MPNWCLNEMIVTGAPEEVDKFVNDVETRCPDQEMRNKAKTAIGKVVSSIRSKKISIEMLYSFNTLLNQKYPAESVIDANNVFPYPDKYRDQDIEGAKHRIRQARRIAELEAHKDKMTKEEYRSKFDEILEEYVSSEEGYNWGGFEWVNNNWGTKWGFLHAERDLSPGKVVYNYDSAWCPPGYVLEELIKRYPKLKFVNCYQEPGIGFQGILSGEHGEVVEDDCFDICEDWTEDGEESLEEDL